MTISSADERLPIEITSGPDTAVRFVTKLVTNDTTIELPRWAEIKRAIARARATVIASCA